MFPGTSSTYAVTIILNGQKTSLSCYLILNQLNMTYYNLVIYLKTI